MKKTPTTIVDLSRLSLSSGEAKRLEVLTGFESLQLAGQAYCPNPDTVLAGLEISRASSGYALRLRFGVHLEGPCMRCLGLAEIDLEIDAREVDQNDTDEEELRSPYVCEEELDVGRWAHDATALAIPVRLLCGPHCAGLCPICGESLNGADRSEHEHDRGGDPRWEKLKDLKLE
jgi:uncharacterized protein